MIELKYSLSFSLFLSLSVHQVSWVLEQKDSVSGSADDLTAVRNHTDQMLCLLAEERPQELDPEALSFSSAASSSSSSSSALASMGPILEFVVSERVLERLVDWHIRRGLDPDSQGALLKLFEMLIGQSQQPLLQHTAVLQPLLLLLATCTDPQLGCPPDLEASLVLLLNQVRQGGEGFLFLVFSALAGMRLVLLTVQTDQVGIPDATVLSF